jgi:polyisoprenoid-binding protein YceI
MQKRIDARRYPTIEGVLDHVIRNGAEQSYRVSGDVTFRGVSRRLEDQMQIRAVDGETIQLDGSARIDIRQFGMEPPRILLLKVKPEVDVRVEIFAVRET